jgi:hypothetical protein
LILGALAFIIFLWSSNSDNDTWRRIILAGWALRSITLASLVIRWAVAGQAGVCASILAALALHRYEVLLPDSAAVSTIRHLNVGPHSLLLPLAKALKAGKGLRAWIIVSLLSLTTILSQFTSTVLLSDVHRAIVISDLQSSVLPYALNSSRTDTVAN